MAEIPERAILEILTHDGRALADWFLVRWHEPANYLPLAWSPVHGPMACAIEQADEARAVVDYLQRHGARQFGGRSELLATAKQEQWPGWEKFCT